MKNYFGSLGRPPGGHAMLSPFFQYLYCTVFYEKNPITCFQLSPNVQQSITTPCILFGKWELLDYCVTVQCHKNASLRFVSALNFIVLSLMYHALTSAQNSYKERTRCYRTKPDQLYPRAFSLRPNRVLLVFAIFQGLIGEKMLALRLRALAT